MSNDGTPGIQVLSPEQENAILQRLLAGEAWQELAAEFHQSGGHIRELAEREGDRIGNLVVLPGHDPYAPAHDDDHFSLHRHPDDEMFDRLTIDCVPRWKESELSGDEYRFSYVVTLWRKGMVWQEKSFSRLQWAQGWIPAAGSLEDSPDDRRPAELRWTPEADADLCCQPGCANVAVAEYRRKQDWCSECGNAPHRKYAGWDSRRRFCVKHLGRGDCALDDADHNYIALRTRMDVPRSPWIALANPVDVGSPAWSSLKQTLRDSIRAGGAVL